MTATGSRPAVRLGSFQLVERLRGPALAERHLVLDGHGRYVVVHLVHLAIASEPSFRTAFSAHAAAAAALDHPGIARVLDHGEIDGRPYIAVEHVEGEDLAARLAALRERGERLPRRDVRQILMEIGSALAAAHERGVLHGDVRPGNIVLTAAGAAVLTGFALGRALQESTTTRVSVGGASPAYVAPENTSGAAPDARSELYSLAVVAYELLAGRPPYLGDPPLAVLLAHGKEPLPLPSQLDGRVGATTERVLLRALARDPADRYPDVGSFAKALDRALSADGQRGATAFVPAVPAPRGRPIPPERERILRSAAIGGLAGLLAFAVVALGLLIVRPAPAAAPATATAAPAPTPLATVAVATLVPAAPTPSPPPSTPELLREPLTGRLLYEARLDGTSELDQVRVFSGARSDAAIAFEPGAIRLEVQRAQGGAIGFFRIPALTSYAANFQVSVPRTSEALLSWALRRDGDLSYLLRLDARTETLSLVYDDGVRWREAVAPQIRVPGLRTERPVSIGFSVDGPDIAVYVDGRLVMQARDARITRTTLPPDVFVGEEGGVGAIRILSARLYALP